MNKHQRKKQRKTYLTKKRLHKEVLAWLIGIAEEWRGSMVGNPNPQPLEEYDNKLEVARLLEQSL